MHLCFHYRCHARGHQVLSVEEYLEIIELPVIMLPGFHAYNRTLKKYKFCADLDMKTAQFISIM
jgi:hypothetical protein